MCLTLFCKKRGGAGLDHTPVPRQKRVFQKFQVYLDKREKKLILKDFLILGKNGRHSERQI